MTDTTTIELPAEGITVELTDAGRRALLVIHRSPAGALVGITTTDDEAHTVNASAANRLAEQLLVTTTPVTSMTNSVWLTPLGERAVGQLYGDPSSSGPEVGE